MPSRLEMLNSLLVPSADTTGMISAPSYLDGYYLTYVMPTLIWAQIWLYTQHERWHFAVFLYCIRRLYIFPNQQNLLQQHFHSPSWVAITYEVFLMWMRYFFFFFLVQFLRKMAQPYDKTGASGKRTLLSQEDVEKMSSAGADEAMFWLFEQYRFSLLLLLWEMSSSKSYLNPTFCRSIKCLSEAV